ncbi:MAG: hypothetical protein EOM19_04760 [Candidatus Moranbacteria bacterium]|nr:hypothetical protein [Candidatus Moranbacteria bacterium]
MKKFLKSTIFFLILTIPSFALFAELENPDPLAKFHEEFPLMIRDSLYTGFWEAFKLLFPIFFPYLVLLILFKIFLIRLEKKLKERKKYKNNRKY